MITHMRFDKKLLDELTCQAKENPRLRQNLDMRTSSSDTSQRMLNALEPGTIVPIHRHRTTSETVSVLRGSIMQCMYDDDGNEVESFKAGPQEDCVGFSVPAGVWHRSISLESGTVILEAKDGAYVPISEEDILDPKD